MTDVVSDLAAEALLVAAALDGQVRTCGENEAGLRWVEDGEEYEALLTRARFYGHERAVILRIARRLREARRGRDYWRNITFQHIEESAAAVGDTGPSGCIAVAAAPSVDARGTGVRRCMVATPADHCTGGYAVDRDDERTWHADALRRTERAFG
jgi:hypothetical protein